MSNTGGACAESEPFALQVIGKSMEPEFPEGCIIVSEPNAVLIDGCYVIAKHQGEYYFRQLNIDAKTDKLTLTALQAGEPVLELESRDDIRARVVQKTMGRRKTRKSYV